MIGFQIEVTGYKGDSGMLDMYTGKNISLRILQLGDTHWRYYKSRHMDES